MKYHQHLKSPPMLCVLVVSWTWVTFRHSRVLQLLFCTLCVSLVGLTLYPAFLSRQCLECLSINRAPLVRMSELDKVSSEELVEEAGCWASQDSWMSGFFLKVMEILQRISSDRGMTNHAWSICSPFSLGQILSWYLLRPVFQMSFCCCLFIVSVWGCPEIPDPIDSIFWGLGSQVCTSLHGVVKRS